MHTSRLLPTALVVTSLLFAPFAFAQEEQAEEDLRPDGLRVNIQNDLPVIGDFTVAPTRYVLPVEPGEERTVEVQITNRRGTPATFALSAEDFVADPSNEGAPLFINEEDSGPYTARLWVEPEFKRVRLNHGERAFVRLRIRVPENAEPGDHQAALIVRRELENRPTSGFGLESRVATLLIVSVSGDVVQDGSLLGIHAKKFLNWWLPVFLRLEATNRGTVHMAPTGTVEIRNIFGITVDELPVNNWIILRDSSRPRELQWTPRFALGRYTATANLTVFGGRVLQPVSTSFWVIPLLPLLGVMLVIFLLSFGVQYFRERFEIRRKP